MPEIEPTTEPQAESVRDQFITMAECGFSRDGALDLDKTFEDYAASGALNGVDSLDVVELVLECEDQFDIEITDAELEKVYNLRQLLALSEKKIKLK